MNTIIESLKRHANSRPKQLAFVGETAQETQLQLSYQQLAEQVFDTAANLTSLKVKVLALRAENSISWLVVDLAAMVADVVVVPIPTFFTQSQVEHSLEQSGADTLIGDWIESADQLLVGYIANLAVYRRAKAKPVPLLAGTSKITFTSGSTGQPKGVCLSQQHLSTVASSLATTVTGLARKHLILLPLSTLLENITGVYVPILLGASVHVYPGRKLGLLGSSQFNAAAFAQQLADIQPQSLVLTPALLLALIKLVQSNSQLAQALKFVAVGGARVSAQLISAAHDLGIPAYEGYGLSECGSVVCLNTPKAFKAGSCGKPLSHSQLRIAEDGELLVKGNSALGYLSAPFIEEWLATGDLASIDEQGFVHLLGRKKNLLVTAFGRNISPEWIESEAQALLPGVPLFVTGDGQEQLCAVSQHTSNIDAKLSELNSKLPDYARIGRILLLEKMHAIPNWFTANGKIRRDQLEQSVSELLSQNLSNVSFHEQMVTRIDLLKS
ncbi:AMP-binding protein [Agarivorans sp.]|uniref:AMP-binding protein n=1 Tax=Agarivorans sp. TaxID=1872412 RepID=UPI003CFF7217